MANGKLMVCDSINKTSQRAKILLTEQIHKGGVPLFEERGTVFSFDVFIEKYISCRRFDVTTNISGRWRVLDVSPRTSLNRQIQMQHTHRYRYLHLGEILKSNLLKSDTIPFFISYTLSHFNIIFF